MALVLVLETGAGLTDSNTYCSLAQGDTYHESRLHVSDWTGATDDEKNRGLASASRLLDELISWNGYRKSDDQALRWPRQNVYGPDYEAISEDAIPDFLRDATAEFARLLIASDRTADPDTLGFSEIKAGSLELKVDKWDRGDVLPSSVWLIVRAYGKKASSIRRLLERG